MINILIKSTNKIIEILVTLFFVLIILIGCYALYDNYLVQKGGKLDEEILSLKPKTVSTEEDKEVFYLDDLQEINSDIVGWITIDNTEMDYPVVKGKDNSEYLDRNYKHEYATSGSIFMDYRNNKDFNDDYTAIYGHHMNSNTMFTDIKKYENEEFFNSHLKGTLYTSNKIYDVEIVYYAVVSSYDDYVFDIFRVKNKFNKEIIEYVDSVAKNRSDTILLPTDKLMVLSTCDSSGSTKRAVLLAKITESNKEDGIEKKEEEKEERQVYKNKKKRKNILDMNISPRKMILYLLFIVVIIIFLILIYRVINYQLKKMDKKKKNNKKK